MSDDSMIDDDEAGLAVIGRAIRNLAQRERKPNDLAALIAGGGFHLASADADDLCDAASDDDLAAALGFCAGLALQARQALRHYCGVTVETEARKGRTMTMMKSEKRAVADPRIGANIACCICNARLYAAELGPAGAREDFTLMRLGDDGRPNDAGLSQSSPHAR